MSLIMERNADVCRADQLLLFVIFFVFLELRLFVAKQFLEHPAPLKIGRVFDHCPIVLNVLSSDKTFHNNSARQPRAPGSLEADQCIIVRLKRPYSNGKGMAASRYGSGACRVGAKYLRYRRISRARISLSARWLGLARCGG